uniref:Uncharacterized protein n=1 Tax=Glossina brevipalpis TaxID=37001 RepID=A0A1A9W7E2_9MUSC
MVVFECESLLQILVAVESSSVMSNTVGSRDAHWGCSYLRRRILQRLLSSEESSNSMVAVRVVVLAGSSLGFIFCSSTLFTVAIKHLSCTSCMAVTRGLLQFSSQCRNFSPCFMASRCSLS